VTAGRVEHDSAAARAALLLVRVFVARFFITSGRECLPLRDAQAVPVEHRHLVVLTNANCESASTPSVPLPALNFSTSSCFPTSSEPTGSASSGATQRAALSPNC
jgi:hypothetical protein